MLLNSMSFVVNNFACGQRNCCDRPHAKMVAHHWPKMSCESGNVSF
jgi:hypothetical protein